MKKLKLNLLKPKCISGHEMNKHAYFHVSFDRYLKLISKLCKSNRIKSKTAHYSTLTEIEYLEDSMNIHQLHFV